MAVAFHNGRCLLPTGFVNDHAVIVEADRIVAVVRNEEIPINAERMDLGGRMMLPGLVDVQVNGGGGVLFNDAPTVDAIRTIGKAHRRFGTTGFLPTLISDDLQTVSRAIAAVDEAIAAGVPGVLGIHIEGPFLNPARKGIHDAAFIRKIDQEGMEIVTGLKNGKTLITLAPECVEPHMIAKLVSKGAIVSAGHTDASFDQTRSALAAGLSGFTHLFNAMSQITARSPGVVGAALNDEHSWCGIIVDGLHVDPVNLKIALRARGGHEKFMLVTDAMPNIGADLTEFQLQAHKINVSNQACRNQDGTLAGANLDMFRAVRLAHELLDLRLEDAIAMGSINPARFLGLDADYGSIATGKYANLLIVDETGRLEQTITAEAGSIQIQDDLCA
ncbi:MAG: N-acetylglucosamine-6-phosphate deacetylase [Sphingorhabdus sp.]